MPRTPYPIDPAPPDLGADAVQLSPWTDTSVVGKRLHRVDGHERVSGAATYARDIYLPGMLYGAIVRCPHAHARVKAVDTARAARMPGVVAVITGSSPGASIGWYYKDHDKPTSFLFDPHCRHEGEEVAAVTAETPQQAWDAARAMSVEYEILPFLRDYEAALKPGAPSVHEGGNLAAPLDTYERGNIAKGFAEAEVVRERTYRTSCELHTPAETHGSVAHWEGNRLTVWDTTQGVFGIQQDLAHTLKLPLSAVRVISPYMGGGFGSKLDLNKHTVIAALLSKGSNRPVKICLSREESFTCVGNRPPATMWLKAGVKRDGTLTALHLTNLATAGAYPGDSGVAYLVAELYQCPNVRLEEQNVYINAGQGRAMRAPGFPQCAWALEQMMDELAEAIGMDPIAFRVKNIPAGSQVRENRPYTSNGLKQCLTEGAAAFGWDEARRRKSAAGPIVRGVGVACAQWGWAGEAAGTAIVKLLGDGSVNLAVGASDIGTGTKTVMAMIVAEELGVSPDAVEIEHADTATTQYAPMSAGSQTVVAIGPAVRSAALEVRRQLLEMAATDMKLRPDEVTLKDGKVVAIADPSKSLAIADITQLKQQKLIVGVGKREPHRRGKVPLPFAAQFAEVEVNKRTGQVRVLRMVAAHDSGRPMNLLTYQNQVFGGIAMGIGFALTERRILCSRSGRMVNANWHDYKIPSAKDVPEEHVCIPVDPHDVDCNSIGAKGLGEPATIPTAAAIANAVYNATGVRVTDSPISPMQMLRLLSAQKNRR